MLLSFSFKFERTIEVAGRKWTIIATPARGSNLPSQSMLPWGALALGLAFTGIAATYFRSIHRHTDRTEEANLALSTEVAERKRVEEERKGLSEELDREHQDLKKVQRLLGSLVENAGNPIVTMDIDGRITSWNSAAMSVFGYTKEEVLGKSLFLVLPHAPTEDRRTLLERVLDGEVIKNYEVQRTRKDSTLVHVSLTLSPVRSADGAVVGVSGIYRDITEPKRAEEEIKRLNDELENKLKRRSEDLQEAEAYLQNLVENAGDPIIASNMEDRITSWNPAAMAIFGYTKEEALGKPISLIRSAEEAEKITGLLEAVKNGEVITIDEAPRLRKDRTLVDMTLTLSPIRDAKGAIVGISGVYKDITERKRAEELLRASEERTRLTVDAAYDAFITIDANGLIAGWNHQAEVTFGWSREEALGQLLAETIIPPRYRDAHTQGIKHFLATGEGPLLNKRVEITALHRDGHEVPVSLTITPIRLGDSYIFSAFAQDISGRKGEEELKKYVKELIHSNMELQKAQTQLLHAEKLSSIGTLVAGVSHEIMNPLTIVTLQLHMLQSEIESQKPEEIRSSCDIMKTQVERILGITQNLLQFARQRKPEVKPLRVENILEQVVRLLEYQYRADSVEVVREYAPDVPEIDGDEDQLGQIFFNFLANARYAMPKGGQITLGTQSCSRDGAPWVRITVKDTGTGIPSDVQKRIFDPFFTTKPEGKGTGLGLSISYGIIKDHGGDIEVQSREGKGTTFLVELPASGGRESQESEKSRGGACP